MAWAASPIEVVATASGLLGEPLTLVSDLSFSRRAVVARLARPDGRTVIAKRPAESLAFRRELAAYEVLPPATRGALLGHDDGVLVVEDLGTGPSLADLLLGDDPDAARAGVLAWARGVGRMAAGSLGQVPVGDAFPPRGDLDASRMLAQAEELGLARVPVAEEIRAMTAALDPPAALTALTPADVCPDNNRVDVVAGQARFFDFEFSSWHHVALDVSFCRLPFSTCWCVAPLPADLAAAAEDALVAELGGIDRRQLAHATTLAGAWFVLDTISSLWRRAEDYVPVPGALMNGRQRARFRLVWLTQQAGALPHARHWRRVASRHSTSVTARPRRCRRTPRSGER